MASSSVVSCVPHYQVFLNFRGDELRNRFISHLERALKAKNINIFIDRNAPKGESLDIFFEEIKRSRIALAVFSQGYTGSDWCLNELVKIGERMDEGNFVAIPIFYMVEPKTVKHQEGPFGDVLRKKRRIVGDDQMKKWEGAFKSVCNRIGFTFDGTSNESKFIDEIVQEVLKELNRIPSDGSLTRSLDHSQNAEGPFGKTEPEIFGLEQRLLELQEMVDSKRDETRIIGVVGMHGIGKTTLVNKFFETRKSHFVKHCLLRDISELVKFKGRRSECLTGMLLKGLLADDNIDEETYEPYKKKLCKNKVFIVLDGISEKTQIEVLLKDHHDWTKKGSKIVIATNDRSLLEGFVQDADIYEVPQLNHRDGLKHFHLYAFSHNSVAHKNNYEKETFKKVSSKLVSYVRGHPLALQLLGEELCEKPVAKWEEKLNTLSPSIRSRVLQVSYDELSPKLKDAFLDIACFRSRDLVYVTSILDSSGPEAKLIIEALKDKFLINTSDSSRLEMHDLLYNFAKEICSESQGKRRHQRNANNVLRKQGGNNNVRVIGIFLDLSQIKEEITLGVKHFKKMCDLRYVKLYSSHCPQQCKPNHKIRIPEGLDFPLEEIRCLHWLNYPLEELPPNFNPKNLVDLKLPYSEIEQIWKNKKDAPKLKWVDLNHSSKLNSLSGLSKAQNLQRLNLEGCTALKTLDPDMQNMESLVFLNLKGCTALESFPDITLVSLKTLILSNCSNLESFLVNSEILEVLYLDGTAITEVPTTMVKLVKLNMQDCKMLKRLPEEFDKLKVLQELVCSGCSKLSSLPDVMENMKCLQILLLDGTAITKIPHISSLERLCLSGNDHISLSDDMSQLSQLKWLDLRYCKNLLYIPKLPPNLQCLDAHGCGSLKRVANPVATHLPMEQIHSSFIFTNCDKLGRTAKTEITTYAQRKCIMLSYALKCCDEGIGSEALFSTCFPGCEVPSWFCHEEVGSTLKPKLPAHWNENKFVGIALCAVVSSQNCEEEINSFSVTCKFDLENKDKLQISFDRLVGHWNKHSKKPEKMASDHVFICYTRCSNNIKCLEDTHSGTCIPITASLEFGVTDEKAKLEVLKCGLRLVYASDEPQKTNSDVTEVYNTSQTDEQIDLQSLPPIRNDSFNSNGNGSDSSVPYEES
ncbi:hypothetical protein CARUB_v10007584mg [Capsella rubella]|uniref:ADP-ribosyl cyclase/cyclic ADP-ribose hydrolase n=1 Tax=Capsella rubella TaxID=81985 RepID=R0H2R9_9BRAS|nr:hypothetical protein CARUB_v10007584mg [Capsella rubella]